MSEDLIRRSDALKALGEEPENWTGSDYEIAIRNQWNADRLAIETVPSAQPERDIPVKPIETTDRSWGIPKRQAVCPRCDYYLGDVDFFGDGKKVMYCEHCGQAIDWEGWCND